MSGYKSFAIVGAGNVGSFVAEAFLNEKASGAVSEVVVLTRPDSTNKDALSKLAAKGAKVVTAAYDDKPALIKALAGVDVIVSTVGSTVLATQVTIAEAGKQAGAKLFVPSEFGHPTEGRLEGFFSGKASLHAPLRAILPITLVWTGPFPDFVFNPYLSLDVAGGKVTVAEDGNKPISWTSRADVGRFLAYVLPRAPKDKLENKVLHVEGDHKSFNEVFKAYEAKTGKKVDVTYKPVSDYEAALKVNQWDVSAALHLDWATGYGYVGTPDNVLYPDWNAKAVVDVLTS